MMNLMIQEILSLMKRIVVYRSFSPVTTQQRISLPGRESESTKGDQEGNIVAEYSRRDVVKMSIEDILFCLLKFSRGTQSFTFLRARFLKIMVDRLYKVFVLRCIDSESVKRTFFRQCKEVNCSPRLFSSCIYHNTLPTLHLNLLHLTGAHFADNGTCLIS